MAQNENYSQVDLRVGTEEQFNAKVGTLPAGTLFGTTDSTVSKADLSTDLKNEINGKINKPANPTSDSAVVINSSGEISTKPLTSITGKAEVAVSSTTPLNDEILWINPDGTSGGGSSSGGKLYRHYITGTQGTVSFSFLTYSMKQDSYTNEQIKTLITFKNYPCYFYTATNGGGVGYISYQIGPGYIFEALLKGNKVTNYLTETYETLTFTDTVTEL